MLLVPEREIANLMTREAAFDAVEKVFAAMAAKTPIISPSFAKRLGMKMRFMDLRVVLIGRD